jgi:hypothetical protein
MQTLAVGYFQFYLALDRIQIAATGRPAIPPFERGSFGQWPFPEAKWSLSEKFCDAQDQTEILFKLTGHGHVVVNGN